jgi:hypothetical protein
MPRPGTRLLRVWTPTGGATASRSCKEFVLHRRPPRRLAHLQFLRSHGVPAWLVFVNFLDDKEMAGPTTPEAWEAAYQVAFHVMGLRRNHPLSRFMVHVYPAVSQA